MFKLARPKLGSFVVSLYSPFIELIGLGFNLVSIGVD